MLSFFYFLPLADYSLYIIPTNGSKQGEHRELAPPPPPPPPQKKTTKKNDICSQLGILP